MREMKDSGIAWIGEIPVDWKTIKNKYLLKEMYSGGTPLATNDNFYSEEGIPFVSISDMSSVDYVRNTNKHVSIAGIADKNLKVLPVGTILYSIYATVGAISELKIEATISQAMLALSLNKRINKKYYKYNLSAMNEYIFSNANGNTQFNLNAEKVNNFIFIFPPLPTQHRIAAYLDDKCAKIDGIIEKERQVIDMLKAYKQSIITEVVTKGLNPNVPMKDSGVEWIGEVPEGWEISKFKRVYTYGKGLPITKADLLVKGIAVISYGQIHSKKSNGLHISDELVRYVSEDYLLSNPSSISNRGDVLFADTSEDYLGVGNCIYNDYSDVIFAGYHTIIARPIDDMVNSKYQSYLFISDIWRNQLRSIASGIKVYSITNKMLNAVYTILPPILEQQAIADYLDDKCAKIDSTIDKKQTVIDKLNSYKKSLIYEVVTGKVEV